MQLLNILCKLAQHYNVREWAKCIHCVSKKTPLTFFAVTRAGVFNNFWHKCLIENRQSEDDIFFHLT